MAGKQKHQGGCLIPFLILGVVILIADKASELLFGAGFMHGHARVIEADLYEHKILEFEDFTFKVKSRIIASRYFVAPGLDQPSIDADGNVVLENVGLLALDRTLELHNIWEVNCDVFKDGNDKNWSCERRTHSGQYATLGVKQRDRGNLRRTLDREGLVWRIGLNAVPWNDACDKGLGLWAGGPYQIPPDVWKSRDPNVDIKDLPRKHCYEGLEKRAVLLISEGDND
ncbi:MAG: hypothetical protein Alpg2KO_09180 [Alphaproteobacteria bacterium]